MFGNLALVLAAVQLAAGAVIPNSPISSRCADEQGLLGPANADCHRQTYQISVTAKNFRFTNVTVPKGTDDATFVTDITQRYTTGLPNLSKFTADFLSNGEKVDASGTYNISGVLCTPKGGAKDPDAVQLLIHGIGTDASYWHFTNYGDVPVNNSYIVHAANAGHTTFRYDRLGTGQSEHPEDAYNVVQAPTDVAIGTKIAQSLKAGTLPGIKAFSKLTVVGHSYGSVQTNALTAVPGLVDHAVFTGFSANFTGVPCYFPAASYFPVKDVLPRRHRNLPYSYLATRSKQTWQFVYNVAENVSPAAARLTRETEEPVTHGTALTFVSIPAPAPAYNGTVAVVTGANDYIFCLGDCSAVPAGSNLTSIVDTTKNFYPSATHFTTYLLPNAGHGISAHKNAGQAYEWIQQYIGTL